MASKSASKVVPRTSRSSAAAAPEDASSRRTRKLVQRDQAARRVRQAAPQGTRIHPAAYGVGIGLAIGLLGLFAWQRFQSGPPNSGLVAAESSEGDPSTADGSVPRNEATLTGFPDQLAAEQEAARRKAEEEAAALAARQKAISEKIVPFLTTHCAECHGADSQEGGITVHQLTSPDQFMSERKSWERVYRMINAGAMPPADYDPQPTALHREEIALLMHEELYNFDCDLVRNPGRATVQRLNRVEYNNTIRDLFGVDITPADNFPADDVGEGFDNIGDVLSLPPLLLEKYLIAAEEVANVVVDTRDFSREVTTKVDGDGLTASNGSSGGHAGFRVLASTGELFHDFDVIANGEYEVIMMVGADQAGPDKAKFALKLGTETAQEFEVQQHQKAEEFRFKTPLIAGKQHIGVAFLNDYYNDKEGGRPKDRNLGVKSIALRGPIGGGTGTRSASHQRLVIAQPGNGVSVQDAATQVLTPLLPRAFRREVSAEDVFRYAGLVRSAVDDMGESYEAGISLAVQAILVAPDFLFRLEQDPVDGETERSLNDFEVASRLSYFLWSSMPDEELLRLASQKQLTQPDIIRQQVVRMLKDSKAEALVQNFAAQWLNLRNLNEVTPNTDIFKSFDDNLRKDMRRETELLFRTVMQEDLSIEELLSADFTFVNQRLAKLYGISGVSGDEFQKVSLKGTKRSGVLTHASILTLTSNPGRTSPVKRGKWIMENIFGEGPPPPPPNVPELEVTAKVSPELTLREQLAKHREDPGCASCHKVMDPLGLGLENFNAIGEWRDRDGDRPIDASGSLPGGESFNGPLELVQIVRARREKFARTMTEKMLTYAIGRGILYFDKCEVDEIQKQLKETGYRFSTLVEGIVLSDAFLKRAAAPEKIASQQ
ncbi:MAG: DUF1592 domain-containing protein [Planctomycetaceae bacterium]